MIDLRFFKYQFIVFPQVLTNNQYRSLQNNNSQKIVKAMIENILKQGKSLQEFETPGHTPIFEDANHYPDFFRHNLVDDARVIKIFKDDPQANIRVFYYQYLKLCFELECENVETYINKIEDLITNPEFHFLFPQNQHLELFSDGQFKRLFIQFFDILNEGNLNVQQALCKYPIADAVLVFFFRTLLIFGGKTQNFDDFIDKTQVFQFLISYFGVEVNVHENCLKFVQTDIFVYQENKNEVFMVYIDYDKKNVDPFGNSSQVQRASERSIADSESNSQPIEEKKKHMRKKTDQSPIKAKQFRKDSAISKDGSCIGDFVDYTQQQSTKQLNLNHREERKGVAIATSQYSSRENQQGMLKLDSKASYDNNKFYPILKQKLPDNTKLQENKKQNYVSKFSFNMEAKQFGGVTTLTSVYADTQSNRGEDKYKTQLDNYTGNLHQSYLQISPSNKVKDPLTKVMSATTQQTPQLNNKAYINNHFGYSFGEQQRSPMKNINANNYNSNNLSGQQNLKSITPEIIPFSNFLANSPNLMQVQNVEIRLKTNNQPHNRLQVLQSNTFNYDMKNQTNKKNQDNFDYYGKAAQTGTANLKNSQYISKTESKYDYSSKKGYMKGINITRQFTDSIILKAVAEPHKSIIQNMKSRARAARDSLNNHFK